MQADDTAALQKSNHGNMPFHLSSLDFDISPAKLQLLSSEQLALVQFHPDATDAIKIKAEILFFRRREQDLHLLDSPQLDESSSAKLHDAGGDTSSTAKQMNSVGLDTPTSLQGLHKETPPLCHDIINNVTSNEIRQELSGHDGNMALDLEEGELQGDQQTPTPEISHQSMNDQVKKEAVDDDLVILGSSTQSHLRGSASNSRASVPLALNVGATYGRRLSSIEHLTRSTDRSLEPHASSSTARMVEKTRSSRSHQKSARDSEDYHRSHRSQHKRRRRDEDSSAKTTLSISPPSKVASKRKSDGRDSRSRPTRATSSHARRRRRSYSTSSDSFGSSTGSYSDGSYSSSSSSSGSSNDSRSPSPQRRRRRRRNDHGIQYSIPYAAVPMAAPVQMQVPLTVAPAIYGEENISRQQLSHMYRNVPSNPSELTVRATTAYTASPPRSASNNYNFPGQLNQMNQHIPDQPYQTHSSAPNIHPARAQSIASRTYASPGGVNDPGVGLPRKPSSGPPNFANKPQGNGWPEPPPSQARRNPGWPHDGPRPPRPPPRPRQDRPSGNSWGGRSTAPQTGNSSWSSNSKGASNAWGDDAKTSGNAWGDEVPTRAGATSTNQANNAWGSSDTKTVPSKATASSAWGDDGGSSAKEADPWGDTGASNAVSTSRGGADDDPWK